ncbi:MAG: TonB-dependent receptor, partial [Acidobacteria bacterium]
MRARSCPGHPANPNGRALSALASRPPARARAAFIVLLVACLSAAAPALAQAPRPARLLVTIVDQTGAVIPEATVGVVGLDDATKKASIAPAKTSDKGIATFAGLTPGRYSIHGEFPGFELGLLTDVRLRAGDNKHVLVMPLKKLTEEVTVGRDPQAAAADRAGTFGTALTREQVEALSDDPDEMRRQLLDMAGPGAAIRVDSFEGQQLPPKAQIKAVHITRDMFAAENHMAGGMFIDIITQPGVGPLRGSGRFGFYDSAMEGRNPLIPKKGPAQSRSFGMTLGGSLLKEKSSFSISINGSSSYRTPNLYAATLAGPRAENLNLRTPSENVSVSGLFDYAITKDQTLRLSFNRFGYSSDNVGVGAYDLAERAYSTDNSNWSIRVQEAGPIGRRFFINTRLALTWSDSASQSSTEAPTIVANDAFTSGGGQRAGETHNRGFTLQSDLDYVRGIHSWRTGVQFVGGRYRTDSSSNYLGTYTFESLDAFEAGRPRTYTRRIGDPEISYYSLMGAFYIQDDVRVHKNLTLSPGVRFEAQTHLKDVMNVGPRLGITWAPFRSGKTTIRSSWGIFYDWLSSGTYEQTLRVDGRHQQELIIANPTYPDPGSTGVIPPLNKYLLGDDLRMAENMRTSVGLEQQFGKMLRIGGTYSHVRAEGLLVGRNLNAPIDGVRPDPAFANMIETNSDGKLRMQSLSVNASLNLSPQPMGPGGNMSGPRFHWNRGLGMNLSATFTKAENNTDGAFSVPASGSLATEWGPSAGYFGGGGGMMIMMDGMMFGSFSSMSDIRRSLYLMASSAALKNFNLSVYLTASSGSPYTIMTGRDDNGDLIFNDRPQG